MSYDPNETYTERSEREHQEYKRREEEASNFLATNNRGGGSGGGCLVIIGAILFISTFGGVAISVLT